MQMNTCSLYVRFIGNKEISTRNEKHEKCFDLKTQLKYSLDSWFLFHGSWYCIPSKERLVGVSLIMLMRSNNCNYYTVYLVLKILCLTHWHILTGVLGSLFWRFWNAMLYILNLICSIIDTFYSIHQRFMLHSRNAF
jgi:hypothetical protein